MYLRKYWSMVCGLLLLSALPTWAGEPALDSTVWHRDLKKAHALAQQENKPILIVFGADWCKYCKKLEKETFSDEKMHQFVQDKFIPVYLDLDEEGKIGRILEVKSLPCTVVLSPNADLLGKVVGYKDIPSMEGQLQRALQTGDVLRQASGSKVQK